MTLAQAVSPAWRLPILFAFLGSIVVVATYLVMPLLALLRQGPSARPQRLDRLTGNDETDERILPEWLAWCVASGYARAGRDNLHYTLRGAVPGTWRTTWPLTALARRRHALERRRLLTSAPDASRA